MRAAQADTARLGNAHQKRQPLRRCVRKPPMRLQTRENYAPGDADDSPPAGGPSFGLANTSEIQSFTL